MIREGDEGSSGLIINISRENSFRSSDRNVFPRSRDSVKHLDSDPC